MKRSRNEQRKMRCRRIRAKVRGTVIRPRVSIFRSLTNIYAQVIDDDAGKTLCSASLYDLAKNERKNTVDGAHAVGNVLAKKCDALKIKTLVFDRGGYKYHGKVKALAEGLRTGGIKM